MNIEDLCRLIQVVTDSNLSDFTYEEGGVRISMTSRRGEDRPLPDCRIPSEKAGAKKDGGKEAGVEEGEGREAIQKEPGEEGQRTESEKVLSEPVLPPAQEGQGQTVDSPLVGIFYAAPSETEAPFVQVGDWVKKGQIIAIVEAMKLMNEIECDCDGQVTEILVQNGQTVEYGQPLIRVLPK